MSNVISSTQVEVNGSPAVLKLTEIKMSSLLYEITLRFVKDQELIFDFNFNEVEDPDTGVRVCARTAASSMYTMLLVLLRGNHVANDEYSNWDQNPPKMYMFPQAEWEVANNTNVMEALFGGFQDS